MRGGHLTPARQPGCGAGAKTRCMLEHIFGFNNFISLGLAGSLRTPCSISFPVLIPLFSVFQFGIKKLTARLL
jgi:hypothetical protein